MIDDRDTRFRDSQRRLREQRRDQMLVLAWIVLLLSVCTIGLTLYLTMGAY